MEDNAWVLSLSDEAAKMISNSDLLINSDGKNCFAIHCVPNAHAFQEHIFSGKEKYGCVCFLHASQSKG